MLRKSGEIEPKLLSLGDSVMRELVDSPTMSVVGQRFRRFNMAVSPLMSIIIATENMMNLVLGR